MGTGPPPSLFIVRALWHLQGGMRCQRVYVLQTMEQTSSPSPRCGKASSCLPASVRRAYREACCWGRLDWRSHLYLSLQGSFNGTLSGQRRSLPNDEADLNAVTVQGRANDLILMSTGYPVSPQHPKKAVYVHNVQEDICVSGQACAIKSSTACSTLPPGRIDPSPSPTIAPDSRPEAIG